jgi:hypothetical protein
VPALSARVTTLPTLAPSVVEGPAWSRSSRAEGEGRGCTEATLRAHHLDRRGTLGTEIEIRRTRIVALWTLRVTYSPVQGFTPSARSRLAFITVIVPLSVEAGGVLELD